MPAISYQLYSSRNWPIEETVAMLEDLGVEEVEGFGPLYDDPAATKALLDAHGLKMTTGHFALDLVEGDPERTLEIARILGVEAVIVPWIAPDLRPTDKAGWQALAERVAKAGEPIRAAGLAYGWHNHDFEFLPCDDGTLGIEEIAAQPGIGLELDLAWIHVAGEDPSEWIEKYAGKILAVHIKDRAPAGEKEDEGGWADLGEGEVDYTHIILALGEAEVERWVIEHDNPSDHRRFATRSFNAVSMFV
ncbi:MAG: sugar phosphate isomerase/epimerase [Maritimibacter sp.]|nr:sugar phosphate isomerase/epimerase [Maritimibacter sp.]